MTISIHIADKTNRNHFKSHFNAKIEIIPISQTSKVHITTENYTFSNSQFAGNITTTNSTISTSLDTISITSVSQEKQRTQSSLQCFPRPETSARIQDTAEKRRQPHRRPSRTLLNCPTATTPRYDPRSSSMFVCPNREAPVIRSMPGTLVSIGHNTQQATGFS